MPVARYGTLYPLPPWSTALGARHGRAGTAFIHENQMLRVHLSYLLVKDAALLLDTRTVTFLGMKYFLLAGDLQVAEGASDGHQATWYAQTLSQFLQGGVGLFLH